MENNNEKNARELTDEELTGAAGGVTENVEPKYKVGAYVEFFYDEPHRKGHTLDKGTIQGLARGLDYQLGYLVNGERSGLIIVKEYAILKVL